MNTLLLWLGIAAAWADPEEIEEPAPEPVQLTPEGIPVHLVEAAQGSAGLPLWQRMRDVSGPMKGTPYQTDPIGEATGPDPDPLARYDVFDCLTFVEEVLALVLPDDPRKAEEIRNALRYGPSGEVSYVNRNHFMMHQWIPHNVSNGMLVDITDDFGTVIHMDKVVRASTWMRWKSRPRFHLSDSQFPVGEYQLKVLPLDQALVAIADIPPGALVLTIRENRSYVPIVVTHIGFVVPTADPSRPLIRHATKMGSVPRVRDDFLDWYFEHLQNYKYWKVAGVVILMPQEL